ncbi:hypothetical protein [Nocardioides stalactiti]|uniref:hypothetical protein n=1 Tax=Nocardioides stalactiti TaxID=2755356 RepID=UPI001603A582|nr:hypothetical protein [Nocardioides stalactiti]
MSTTTAKIAAASCKDTGVTPDLAAKMWAKLGSRHIAIVELIVDERSEDSGDTRGVKLTVASVEPAVDSDAAEHLRELQRAFYTARQPNRTLLAGVEATPRDVIIRGQVEVLFCDHCGQSFGSRSINHGRRDGVACIYTPCRHPVLEDVPRCPCTTDGELLATGAGEVASS